MTDGREVPAWLQQARDKWADSMRPDGIVTPGPGQESVWDYPRPPMLQRVAKRVRVDFGGQCIVDTAHAQRICETASPPTYYVPPADIAEGVLVPIARQSLCEWKGDAAYFDVQVDGQHAPAAAWCYPSPFQPFGAIAGWIAFMPAAMQACFVGEDRVVAQPGGFYGGWITPELTGPFKGAPGTGHW